MFYTTMKKYPFSIFLLALAFSVYGRDSSDPEKQLSKLLPALSQSEIHSLVKEKELTRYYFSEDLALFLPLNPFKESITEELHGLDPNIGVESLYLLSIPGFLSNDNQILTLYNILRSVSTLKGIEYFSASRGRMRTFIKEAYTVNSFNEKERIPDQTVDRIPLDSKITVFQEDLTFGKGYYSIVYRYSENIINLFMKNLTTLWYGVIPLIREENMHIHIAVFPLDNRILFYGNCGVKTVKFFGLEKTRTESFYYRIEALFRWFSDRIKEVYKGGF